MIGISSSLRQAMILSNNNYQRSDLMHNNSPKEPIPPSRDNRPLQKSMFVDHYQPNPSYNPNPNPASEQTNYHPLKRSLMDNPNNPAPQYQFRTQAPTNSNFNSTPAYQPSGNIPFSLFDPRLSNQREIIHHSSSTTNIKSGISLIRADTPVQDPKSFRLDKPDSKPPLKPKGSEISDNMSLINEVVNQIRQKHLPPLINLVKKEFYEEIQSLKQEFINFREEMWAHKAKQESINTELKSQANLNKFNEVLGAKQGGGKDGEVELHKEFFLLEGKIKQLESKINEGLQRVELRLDEQRVKGFKSSAIRSNLSPIMLEYKELFTLKGGSRNSAEQSITLSACHYYIDKNGYLMDNESRYLIDRKGSQIRLQQKHLRLLEKHKILHK